MAKRYNATEYMYSSARLRAMEGKLADREAVLKLCELNSAIDVLRALPAYGFRLCSSPDGRLLREETLMSVLEDAFREVEEMECSEAVKFLRYRYDCNNIKAVLKCKAASASPDGMLASMGSVGIDAVKASAEKEDYSAFPPAMREAIPEAVSAYLETKNPQMIDFIIDKACFADMSSLARACGISLCRRLVCENIDMLNIIMCVRIIRMRLGERTETALREVLLSGGELDTSLLISSALQGEKGVAEAVEYRGYERLAVLIRKNEPFSALEKELDNRLMATAKEAKLVPFGAEVAVGYIMAAEYAVKNIRIIIAGKTAGLSAAEIRERLRECYV